MRRLYIVAVMMLFTVTLCDAGTLSLTPKYGKILLSKNLNLKDAVIYGIGLSYMFTEDVGVEFEYYSSGKMNTTMEDKGYMHAISQTAYIPYNGDARLQSFNINLLLFINSDRALRPFFKLGAGYTVMDSNIERQARRFNYGSGGSHYFPYKKYKDYKTFTLNTGLGVEFLFSDWLSFQVEMTEILMFNEADFAKLKVPYQNIAITGGIKISY